MSISVQTLTVRFDDIALQPDLIRRFQGEVVARAPAPDDRLHNHAPDGASLYRYPLVQYRVWQSRATLFALGEGVGVVQTFLQSLPNTPYHARPALTEVGLTDTSLRYAIDEWYPLNTENLKRWEQTSSLRGRVALLEGILVNQLLVVCQAMGYQVPDRGLQVEIQELTALPARRFHTHNGRVQARLFAVTYAANLRLPDGIGVGKGVSKGFGVQTPVTARSAKTPTDDA